MLVYQRVIHSTIYGVCIYIYTPSIDVHPLWLVYQLLWWWQPGLDMNGYQNHVSIYQNHLMDKSHVNNVKWYPSIRITQVYWEPKKQPKTYSANYCECVILCFPKWWYLRYPGLSHPGDHPTWAAGGFTGKIMRPTNRKKKGNFTKTADLTLSLLTGAFDVGLLDGLGCWGCWDYEIHSRGSFPKIPYV